MTVSFVQQRVCKRWQSFDTPSVFRLKRKKVSKRPIGSRVEALQGLAAGLSIYSVTLNRKCLDLQARRLSLYPAALPYEAPHPHLG